MPIKFLNSGLLEGSLQLTSYGGGSISGTGTYNLGVDASGNVIETSLIEGSGTANYVVKWTPDGNTLGDSQIFDDGTYVGIGTANPDELFHIDSGTATAYFRLQGGGGFGRYTLIYNNDNDFLLRADSSSTGTSTGTVSFAVGPTDGVSIGGSGQVTFWQYGSGTFTGTATKNLAVDSSGNVIETDGSIIDGSGTANYVAKWSDPNTLTDSVIYDDGTNVGIGTTNPTSKLEVAGNGKFVNGSTPITLEIGAGSSSVNQTYSTLKLAQGGFSHFHRFQGRKSSDTEGSEYIMEEYTDNNELVRKTNSYDGDTSHILYGNPLSLNGISTNIFNGNIIEINEYIDHTGDDNTRFGFPASDTFAVDTAGSERMRINSTGRVGIATTNPTHRLQIGNGSGNESLQVSSGVESALYLSTPNSTAQSVIGFGNSQFATINTRGRILYQSSTTAASNYMQFTVAFNEVMRLTNDSVGIGTTNPSVALDVNDGSGIKVQNQGDVVFEANPGLGSFSLGDAAAVFGGAYITSDSSNIDFFGDGNVRFQNEGKVGINVTDFTTLFGVVPDLRVGSSSGANNPGVIDILRKDGVVVAGDIAGVLQFSVDDDNNYAVAQIETETAATSGTGSSGGGILKFKTSTTIPGGTPTERLRIDETGDVGIGTTNPRGKLDVNFGEVYVTTPNGIDALKISNADVKIGDYDDANGYAFLHLDNEFKFTTDSTEAMRIDFSGNVGIGTTNPQSKLQINGAVQVANDTATASASKVGALRYRTSGNNSYVDMCMQTGASTYAWVNIVQNTW